MVKTRERRRRGGARPPRLLRPAEIGLIKVGRLGPETTSSRGVRFQRPEKLDYFLLCRPHRGQDGNFVVDEEAMRLHVPDWTPTTPGPKRLPIVLFSQEPTENVYYEWAYYDGRQRRCYNNTQPGEGPATWINDDGEETERECPCELREPDDKGQVRCKDHCVLRCALFRAPQVGGAWVYRTTAKGSADALFNSMDEIRARTEGWLRDLPLELCVYWRTVETNGKRFGVPLVNIEFPGSLEELLDLTRRVAKTALAAGDEMKALMAGAPAPPDPCPELGQHIVEQESPAEQEAFAQEFYPPPEAAEAAAEEEPAGPPSQALQEQNNGPAWHEALDPQALEAIFEEGRKRGLKPVRVRLEFTRFPTQEAFEEWLRAQPEPAAEKAEPEPVPAKPPAKAKRKRKPKQEAQPEPEPEAQPEPKPEPVPAQAEPAEPLTEVSSDDYARLVAMDAALRGVGVEFSEVPQPEALSQEGFRGRLQGMSEAYRGLSEANRRKALRLYEARCRRDGVDPKFPNAKGGETT